VPGQDPPAASPVARAACTNSRDSRDVFGPYLVVQQRHAAATQLRIADRRSGRQRLIEAGGPHISLGLAANEDYHATAVTVRTESLAEPPSWHDVDLATGAWQQRKRQRVPGYDPARYATERITAVAPDGTPVPVTIAYRAGLRRDGSAPCLLYGYGAYESCEWPAFSVARAGWRRAGCWPGRCSRSRRGAHRPGRPVRPAG
jgi:oligopeptidase B